YTRALSVLKNLGATIVEIEEEKIGLPDFMRLLNLDMNRDMSTYLSNYASTNVTLTSVEDVVNFNRNDSINLMPYGQKLFEGVVADTASEDKLTDIKKILKTNGQLFYVMDSAILMDAMFGEDQTDTKSIYA